MPLSLKDSVNASQSFELHRVEGTRAVYRGPQDTDMKTDQLILVANAPKKTAASFGNRRCTVKYIRTSATALPDTTKQDKDMKAELSVSLPVGATPADVAELVAYIRSAIALDEVMIELAQTGKIQF